MRWQKIIRSLERHGVLSFMSLLLRAGPGMERKDLLAKNAGIFKVQGKILDSIASKNVKVHLPAPAFRSRATKIVEVCSEIKSGSHDCDVLCPPRRSQPPHARRGEPNLLTLVLLLPHRLWLWATLQTQTPG